MLRSGAEGQGGRKMRVYTCQETRRLVHNIGGSCADSRDRKGGNVGEGGRRARREERMAERAVQRGHTRTS